MDADFGDVSTSCCTVCSAGKYAKRDYSTSGATTTPTTERYTCAACDVGRYSFAGAKDYCQDCPSGTSVAAGMGKMPSDCTNCAAGKYAMPHTAGCVNCKAGMYSAEKSDKCFECALGTSVAAGAGKVPLDCTNCAAGTFAKRLHAAGDGSYQGNACVDCDAGTYSPERAGHCIGCATDTYSPKGAEACKVCPTGFSSPTRTVQAAVESDSCNDCPAGKFHNHFTATGKVMCQDCAAGQHSSFAATKCERCEPGKSVAEGIGTAPHMCVSCPVGKSTVGHYGGPCVDCAAGRYANGYSCQDCSMGKFSDTKAATVCKSCVPGKSVSVLFSTTGGPGQPAWVPQKATGPDWCNTCVAGMFHTRSSTGEFTCEKCAVGKFSQPSATGCTACHTGKTTTPGVGTTLKLATSWSDCTMCPAGKSSGIGVNGNGGASAGGGQCIDCPAGTFANHEGSWCRSCSVGKYAPAGATTCKACAPGKSAPMRTAQAVNEAESCSSCAPGKVQTWSNATRSEERRVGKECRSRWSPYH